MIMKPSRLKLSVRPIQAPITTHAGCKVVFDKDDAKVIHKASNTPVTTFKRRNALYECDMRLRNPRAKTAATAQEPSKGFRRQERR